MKRRNTGAKKRRTLYIRNPVAHRLAEQVSKRMGVTLTDAVIVSLKESLQKRGCGLDRKKVDALCAAMGTLPSSDTRSAEEILGYDTFGIPR